MKFHKKIAKLFGYELISEKKNHLTLHAHLKSLFKLLRINCVLDVGANVGQYALQLRAHGYKGHIISFEPAKKSYEKLLAQSKNDPLWKVFPFALGSKEEVKTLHITPDSSMASFLHINEFAKKRYQDQVTHSYAEEVTIKTLDSLWREIIKGIFQPSVYLKMDTQGYDLEVLKGGITSIPNILALQSELSLLAIYEGMADYITVLEKCRSFGFDITGIYPVSRELSTLKVVEFDCTMVRSSV